MALVECQVDGHVAIVTLNDGENRFNPTFLDALLGVMDDIENDTEATTLVVRSAHEKIFSNGIDLEWLLQVMQKKDLATAKRFFMHLNVLFKRMVTYPLITIAAITGHAFAGGAIFSSTFDFRFMRSDRGFLCLPEIDLGMPFLPGMDAILHSAIPESVLKEMILTGVRLTAEQCQALNIVKGAHHIDHLMDAVLEFAAQVNKKRPVIKAHKIQLNQTILKAIDEKDPAFIEAGQFHIQ